MTGNQKTIKKSVSFSGRGLHTGVDVKLTLAPAPENHGFQIIRTDLNDRPVIRARAENVVETSRGTTLEENGVKVATIEHVMAACVGSGLDNVIIEMNGPEAPILDGSAKLYVEGIVKAGLKDQKIPRNTYQITEKIEYRDEEHGIETVSYTHLTLPTILLV